LQHTTVRPCFQDLLQKANPANTTAAICSALRAPRKRIEVTCAAADDILLCYWGGHYAGDLSAFSVLIFAARRDLTNIEHILEYSELYPANSEIELDMVAAHSLMRCLSMGAGTSILFSAANLLD